MNLWDPHHKKPSKFSLSSSVGKERSSYLYNESKMHILLTQIMAANPPGGPHTTLAPCPEGLEEAYDTVLSDGAIQFVSELVSHFDSECELLYQRRLMRKCTYQQSNDIPKFKDSPIRHDDKWKIAPLPERLQNRHLDMGDVSPANVDHFKEALTAPVQGIQVDFDDGHCPTWSNQLTALHTVSQVVHNQFPGVPHISSLPTLLFRPRAWNMIEQNMMVNGKKVPGPLFDFGLIMYHNAVTLTETKCGPFMYLSKLEGAEEANLWNEIFIWTQQRLSLPYGTIKACILIENILSSFELDEILYSIKDHSLGLNCGIWDYTASIISKFGHRQEFMLPDRSKYVNIREHFLKSYLLLVIKTCHLRGAPATGGMVAEVLIQGEDSRNDEIIRKTLRAKLFEIHVGVDGFLVYDTKLVRHLNELWQTRYPEPNRLSVVPSACVAEGDLLRVPAGVVTVAGLRRNVEVGVLFVYHWFLGRGHFVFEGAVEDSATAEIARAQLWQWIRLMAVTEDGAVISKSIVEKQANDFVTQYNENAHTCLSETSLQKIEAAKQLFLALITERHFPDFITTYLNKSYIFWFYQQQKKM